MASETGWIVISAKKLESELKREIEFLGGKILDIRGRLFWIEKMSTEPVFAQNIWYELERISFQSISEGTKSLRDRSKFWHLHSTQNHRRAELIQKSFLTKQKILKFPCRQIFSPLSSWTLWSPNEILASKVTKSVFPDGELLFEENKSEAPSRAYLKLWEWMTIHRIFPQPNELCLDFGSAPGGWTWVLTQLGAKVISVDKANLEPSLAKNLLVRHLKKDAFSLSPQEIGPVDWFFSDVICYPDKLYELVTSWLKSGLVKNFVCTIKFQGATDFEALAKFRAIPNSKICHLSANKHEVTWSLTQPISTESI